MAEAKRIQPTVKPKIRVVDTTSSSEPGVSSDAAKKGLPPIGHVKPPEMKHMSTKIRWYLGLGYAVKEVAGMLGVRYQQVRNVATVEPKRAAREDVPPYIIECWEPADDLEAMADHALDIEMAAQREQDREAKRRSRKGLGPQRTDLETDDD